MSITLGENVLNPQLRKLADLFVKNGYELRIAGGAVRDLLMDIVPADVDLASTATPQQMISMFEKENIRMLHKRGEEHGTVTCRIDENNFEVTTLRIDVVCDGRRAEVKFTTDWELDANRRDLTINSLFLELDGTVIDYTGGCKDVANRRVAFVGNAEQRIQEDFLRILRYFRFFGRISDSKEHDKETLDAIKRNKDGLKGVSPERIWTEMKRIVIGRRAPDVIRCMIEECDLAEILGFPSDSVVHLDRFRHIYEYGSGRLDSMTMVASLCSLPEHIAAFHAKTKLSNVERELGEFIVENRQSAEDHKEDQKYWRELVVRQLGALQKSKPEDEQRYRSRVKQLALSVRAPSNILDDIDVFRAPEFPVNGYDLREANVAAGPVMASVKGYLFDKWIQSGYTMNKEELLAHAHDSEIPPPPSKKQGNRKRNRSPSLS